MTKEKKKKPLRPAKPVSPVRPVIEQAKSEVSDKPKTGDTFTEKLRAIATEPEKDAGQWGGARPGAGRKPNEELTAAAADQRQADLQLLVKTVLPIPFEVWSIQQDAEFLKLTDAEAGMIAPHVVTLVLHYFPDMSPISAAWIGLGLSVLGVMGPRLARIADEKKKKPAARAGDSPIQASPGAAGPIVVVGG